MSSNRHRFQEALEKHLGCKDPTHLKSYKGAFENIVVDDNLSKTLANALAQDAKNTFFKATVSLAEGMVSIRRGYHSWAVVKLYYASYYLVRFAFAARSMGIFRCGTLYTLSTLEGAQPIKRPGKGDHKTILEAFTKDYASSERLLSNKINEQFVFEWLMDRREAVHYRDSTFSEPNLIHFDASLTKGEMKNWVTNYLKDPDDVYCFLEDHACLAIPLVFCAQIAEESHKAGLRNILTQEQQDVLRSLFHEVGIVETEFFASLIFR